MFVSATSVMADVAKTPDESVEPVSMAEYRQEIDDSIAVITLLNNTADTVHNVEFVLTYMSCHGKELLTKTYLKHDEILPGESCEIELPRFSMDSIYHDYAKARGCKAGETFDVMYEMIRYNLAKEETIPGGVHQGMWWSMFLLSLIVLPVILVIIYFATMIATGIMARRRHRSVVKWLLLSLLITPVISVFVLMIVGDAKKKYDKYDAAG